MQKPTIVNVHIPKTAGSNFRRQMNAILPVMENGAQILGADLGANTSGSYFKNLRALAKPLFANLNPQHFQFLSGHFRYRDVADFIAANRDQLILTSCLRDPAKRFVSDYLYSSSEAHVGKDYFVKKYPDFKSYLNDPAQSNKQLDYLRPHSEASVQETLAHVALTFDCVLITERFDSDFEVFAKRLGFNAPAPTRQNQGLRKSLAPELLRTYADQLRTNLAPEYELYNTLCATDWGSEPFSNHPTREIKMAPQSQKSDLTAEDIALQKEIDALGPWHHDIAINDRLRTVQKGLERSANENISVTNPADVFTHSMLPYLPNGMVGKSFLDCGCNAGGYCFAAKDAGADSTYGFDARDHWINQAKFIAENRDANSDGMRFAVADLAQLEQMDEMFDVSWFSGLLYHLPDPIHSLKVVADKTRDLMLVNTASIPADPKEKEQPAFVSKFEDTESLMSGVDGLSWLPSGPLVIKQVLAWCGFEETRVLFWRQKGEPTATGRRPSNRLALIAAREKGRLGGAK